MKPRASLAAMGAVRAIGTIKAKNLNAAGTRTAVTITYSG
jgi:hypothetical protein